MANDGSDRKHNRCPSLDGSSEEASKRSKKENAPKIEEIDYDMEEGEIIEDHILHSESLDRGVDNSRKDSVEEEDSYGKTRSNEDDRMIGDEATNQSRSDHLVDAASAGNGPSLLQSGKSNAHYGKERDFNDQSRYMYAEDAQRHKNSVTHSPSYYKYHSKSHSRSPSQARGRSRSQSVIRESSLRGTPHRNGDKFYERDNERDTDDEQIFLDNKTYSSGNREMLREKERERSSTPHRKGYKCYERDTDDERILSVNKIYIRGSREMLREKERDRSSSVNTSQLDRYHVEDFPERDWPGSQEIDRGRIKEKEMMNRERGKAREKEAHRERENYTWRDKELERERDRQRDKERERRERDRERSRDMDLDRESGRGSRHLKDEDDEWDKYDQSRDKELQRERDRQKNKEREMRERDRERSRGSSRDMDLDRESGRGLKDEDDKRDKYGQSRYRRYNESDHQDKLSKSGCDIMSPPEKEKEKLTRFEDEQEEYEERIVSKLAKQEDDDLDKIKEESRRRKLAILEKYRMQQSQQQEATHVELADKDNKDRHSRLVSAENVVFETAYAQTEGPGVFVTESSFAIGKSPPQDGLPIPERVSGTGGLGEGTPKSERSPDMFCDDIFGESPAGVCKTGRGDGKAIERSSLNDNWDDAEGYYSYRFGELLDGRYEIVAAHGKGVFSTVVRAKDLKSKPGDPAEIAIKMIRSNETMYKAGMEELVILKKLVGADPEDRRHCVLFSSSFKYRNHLCLVFESLHMNLREVLKKFGRNIGLKSTAVRAYAKQLFIALKHLRNCGILHCDIKPDNMLVNEAKNVLKLCDFGNAMFAGKNEITPYLVSRFYRAPEISATNNDMLRLHMELTGPFPKKMLRKGAFIEQHFDHDRNFLASEEDPVTKKAIKRLMINIKPKDVGSLILGSTGEDPKMLGNFKDLMERIFVLDPDKRLTVSQALSHPFITGK